MEKNRHILSPIDGLTVPRWLYILFIAALVWNPSFLSAYADTMDARLTLDQILSNVKEHKLKLKTFTASFKQVQKNDLLVEPLVSEGLMFYHHTGKLLMEVSHPEPFVLLLKDRNMIMGDPVKKTFKKRPFSGRNALLKRYVGTGQSFDVLKEKYDIRLFNDGTGTDCQLELVPKKRQRNMPYKFIRVTIDTMRWLPKGIRLETSNNDYTEFELSFLTVNEPLPEKIFTIDLPPEELDDPFEPNK
jgi:outer membrane lipoprotein-sorting protein